MKRLLLLPIFIVFSSLITSKNHNFYIKNNKVVYVKTFNIDSNINDTNVLNFLSTINGLSLKTSNPNFISGKINKVKLNYLKFGFKHSKTFKALNHPMNCNLYVNTKKGKYRVTLSHIKFHSRDGSWSINNFIDKDETSWKKNKIVKRTQRTLDSCFTDLFTFRNVDKW